MESQCDNSNPHYDSGGYFGYTEKFGNHPGGQAEYLKVPFGNFTPFVIPESCELEDESYYFYQMFTNSLLECNKRRR